MNCSWKDALESVIRQWSKIGKTLSRICRLQKRCRRVCFICKCGDAFERIVWHCPICDHHWSMDDTECTNCYRSERPEPFRG
jgi:hypothetical protein